MRMRQPNIEMQQQMEAIYAENEHLTREIAILRDTIKVSASGEQCNNVTLHLKIMTISCASRGYN